MTSAEPIRLVVALTHPIQYFAPWFSFVNATCPPLSLDVLYATEPTSQQQAAGFGSGFQWDVALRDGYRSTVVRRPERRHSVHSNAFFGLDVPELARAVRDREPDVVLVPGWHSVTYVRVLRACRRAGVPVLYRGDSSLLSRPAGWKRAAWAARTRWMLGHYAAYLSVGAQATAYLRAFGVDERRIFQSPHAVDNAFFAHHAAPWRDAAERESARRELGIAPGDFVVLFVGKLEPKKRLRDAIVGIAAAGKEYHLLVAGEGVEHAAARALAHDLGVRATWLGFVNQSSLPRVYAVADCLVLPSDGRETWGLVVNEALATGLPCVVSDAAGCAADLVMPGVTGERYPCGDAHALAAALARARRGIGDGSITARACRDLADRHSFREATRGLVAACQWVTGARQTTLESPA